MDEGTQWFKYQHRIPSDKNIAILVHGRVLREGLEIKGSDKVTHTVEKDTKLTQILEWMGYSLSEEIYLVELKNNGKVSQQSAYIIAKAISESKWRYWTDKGVSQISSAESEIGKEFPNIDKFLYLWEYLYKGKLNFDEMMFSYEDIKAFSDLYTYIESLSAKFLKGNLKVIDKGYVNLQKLEDVFKTSYFYNIKFASPDQKAQLLEGKPPAQHSEIWDNYLMAVNEIYEVIFASGFKNRRLEELTADQSMYTILDIIMRKVVLIQEEPQFGGSGLYEIAPRIRDFLGSAVQSDLTNDILSPIGRYVFFDKLSEMFFDSEHYDGSLIKAWSNLKGRELEARDCQNDFASTLVDILSSSEFVAYINGMNYGRVSLTSTRSKLGLNYFIEEYGSIGTNEKIMFKFPITDVRNSNPTSNRAFPDDGGALITDTSIFFREAKNSASKEAMTWGARRDVSNDLMRDAFMGVQIELATKFQSGTDNVLLKDLRNLVLTATAASRNGPADLTAILNNMAKRSRFKDFRSGKTLKFPPMYTHLYACADVLNAKLGSDTLSRQQAIAKLQSYITSLDPSITIFLTEIKKTAKLYFTNTHFNELPDAYFDNIESYFLNNLQDLLIPSSSGSGFEVSLKDRIDLLFKKTDMDGNPVKLRVMDLPADIMLFENGRWDYLSNKFSQNHMFDSAYIVVHDKASGMNGLMKIDYVMNNLPNDIEEGYFDAATGEVYNNILVCDAYGNYLFSRIDLNTFEAQGDGWYSKYTDTDGNLQKEAYIVFGLMASNQYLCFLFDALININPKEIHKEYLPGINKPKSQKSKIKYILTDEDPIYAGLDQFDLDIRTVSSIVYQFDRGYLLSGSRKSTKNVGPARVLLSDPFFNLYPHEVFYYSLSQYSKVFGALGITDQQLKEIVPMSVSSSSSVGTIALSPNADYSPKRFYNVFREVLIDKADLIRTDGLIDEKIYQKIRNLGGFSDLYEDNLDDDQIDIEKSDKVEIIKLNSILTDIFGYSGYTILKSGFMAIEKTSQGFEFSAFAPIRGDRNAILRKTCMFSIGFQASSIKIGSRYFTDRDSTKLFFIDLLINGHKQGFYVEGNIERIETTPQSPLRELLYPSLKSSYTKISRAFLAAQYEDFLAFFSKDTSSNFIVSSRNIIFQGVWKLLKNAITDAVIISKFPSVIKGIKDNSNPNYPITYARAVEIVKDLVLNYYYTYYLDNIYVPHKTHDYIAKISQLFFHGTTSTIFKSRGQQSSSTHTFFSSFKFTFDLNSAFNRKELVDVLASVAFHYLTTYSETAPRYKPAWSLRLNSIRSEVKDTTIKTFVFLQDVFNNYDPSVKHFSIFFHKPGVSGINLITTLKNRVPSGYKSDEIEGTYIDVDRSNPQSVIDAIASIAYYMQKYNAFVIVKEGLKAQNLNSLVICFDQRKIYRPDVIQSIVAGNEIATKYLSTYSTAHYNNWINQYDQIFNIGNIYPLYLFHDIDKLPQLVVDSLRIYLGVNSRLVELQQAP